VAEEGGISRRSVLIGASATAVSLGVWGALGLRKAQRARKRGTVIGPGRFIHKDTGKMSFVLCLFDLDGPHSHTIDMEFFGHGFAPHPFERGRAVIFEKKGPGCCELDLVEGRATRSIKTPPGRAFYGHGAFSRDGQVLFATENRLATNDGLICVRDGKTYQELAEFPTYGKSPHDCHLVDEGHTLVITNGGGTIDDALAQAAPSVTFVDAASNKLLERVTFATPRINAGHLALSRRGDLVAISAPRDGLPKTALGGVTMRTGQGEFLTMSEPPDVIARMVGESLSLCIDEATSVVGVTNPDGNIVTFWDIRQKRLVKRLDLPAPRGLTKTLDDEYLVLSYGAGTVTLIAPGTWEPVPLHRVARSTVSGSHLFTWDPFAA
jgi:hypothetical protein